MKRTGDLWKPYPVTEQQQQQQNKEEEATNPSEMEKERADLMNLIFIPSPGVGHVISTLEFALCLLDRDDRFLITVLTIKPPFDRTLETYVDSLAASHPSITLIDLPQVQLPDPNLLKSIEFYVTSYIESYVPHVKETVRQLKGSSESGSRVVGLVLDLFCTCMIDVADELGLPSYIYMTCSAGFLDLMLYLPTYHEKVGKAVKDSDPDFVLPGIAKPLPVSVLPQACFDGEYGGYDTYLKLARRFRDAKGIIVNTFEELEPYALRSLRDNECNPVIYTAGPILHLKGGNHPSVERAIWDSIWKWLDDQPPASVVFLCFGSMGSFEEPQLKEIATGLELSGQRFLWSLRSPMREVNASSSVDPTAVLPEGFSERTEGRGIVCEWAPQVDVLNHKAIGGFVSHCGWNSTLESLWHGVPIATWPIYAEQQMNAFRMVKELGLSVELSLDYRGGARLVTAEEISKAIRCLMDSKNDVRKKVVDMKEQARKALMVGGSSFNSIQKLIEDIMNNKV